MTATALVVFSDHPLLEARRKRLLGNASLYRNAKLHRLLRKHCLEQASRVDVPVLSISRKSQHGATFGTRLYNAFADAFKQGHERVVLVGTDASGLSQKDLSHLIESFNCGDHSPGQLLLGPDSHGGAWVIGLDRRAFSLLDLESCNWDSTTLLEELTCLANHYCLQLTKATNKVDLNSAQDLRLLEQLNNEGASGIHWFLAFVRSFIDRVLSPQPGCKLRSILLKRSQVLRGPPECPTPVS